MKPEPISTLRDGLTVRGYLYGNSTEKKPVVLLSHAFLRDQSMCVKYAEMLSEAGYAAITYDFCGGGPNSISDGSGRDMTLFTEKADLLAMLAYVKTQPFADEEHITLLGCSQGAFVSALVAKELGNAIEKLILLYPPLNIPDDARNGKMITYEFDPADIPDLLGSHPMELGGDYARTVIDLDPFEMIGGYDGPVLYLQGGADKVVPLSYPRKAHTLYPHCSYVEIPDGWHIFRGAADEKACELIMDFLGVSSSAKQP